MPRQLTSLRLLEIRKNLCFRSFGILLHPTPPPLIALEEPELGLHPDVVAEVAKLRMQASSRTQIVVTSHSRMLVDALTDHPSSVVVCEKDRGDSHFERLDGTRLKAWLDKPLPAR